MWDAEDRMVVADIQQFLLALGKRDRLSVGILPKTRDFQAVPEGGFL
jgi:hypothetical protein